MKNIGLKIMTFNLRTAVSIDPFLWEQRRHWVAKVINKYRPDFIGTQEARDFMLDWLREHLSSNYDIYGVNRTNNPDTGENSAIFVLKSRFRILKKESFMLSDTPEIIGSMGWDAAYPRICSWAEIALKDQEIPFVRFFNTHLDNVGKIARLEGLKLILRVISEKNKTRHLSSILTGDFNATPDDGLLDVMKDFLPMNSCYDIFLPHEKENALTYHDYKGVIKGKPIDYILCSEEIKIKSTSIIRDTFNGGYPSDHYPVLSEVEVCNE